jgi:hypothetical protein
MIENVRGTNIYHSTERVMIVRLARVPTAQENRLVIQVWLRLGFED